MTGMFLEATTRDKKRNCSTPVLFLFEWLCTNKEIFLVRENKGQTCLVIHMHHLFSLQSLVVKDEGNATTHDLQPTSAVEN